MRQVYYCPTKQAKPNAKPNKKAKREQPAQTSPPVAPVVAPPLSKLQERAMLVYVGFSKLGGSKKDQSATDAALASVQAQDNAGAFVKRLFPGNVPQLKAISSAMSRAQETYYAETLPWLDGGGRLLPAVNFLTFTAKLRQAKEELERAVEAFAAVYDDLVNQQRARLGQMFNRDDYPPLAEIRQCFGVYTQFFPLPAGADFRVSMIEDSAAEEIRKQIEESTRASVEDAMLECYGRLWDVTSHMVEILSTPNPKRSVKDALVENVRAACDAVPRFNLTNDARLTELAKQIRASLCQLDGAALREDDAARERTLAQAAQITADLGAILGLQ